MQVRRMVRFLRRPTSFQFVGQRQSKASNQRQQHQKFSTSPKSQVNDPATALKDALFPGKSPRPPQTSAVESRRPNEPADSSNPFLNAFPSPTSSSPSTRSSSPPKNEKDGTRGDLAEILRRNNRLSPLPAQARNENAQTRALENQSFRQWREGDIVAPHDLSPVEHMKAKKARQMRPNARNAPTRNTRSKGTKDVFDHLGLDPLKQYKNFVMMSEFMTDTGRIKSSRVTGLRGVNQRKMAKAVRRAVGMGLMPSVHKHPELLDERLSERGQIGQFRAS